MPPTGRCERSIGPMLSRPRKPPSNRLLPSASSRLIHHVKLTRSLSKIRPRNSRSRLPSMMNTSSAAHACTGGVTSPKSHSQGGRAPPRGGEPLQRRPRLHRRVHVAEVPLVGGQRAARVLEPLPAQQDQLVLGERGVHVR